MTNKATFQAVRNELESTINFAKAELEAFSADLSNVQAIQKCTDYFGQIRGTLLLMEDAGAAMLAEEVIHALNMLPLDGGQSTEQQTLKKQFDAISQALVILARYFEYLELDQPVLPVLLIPSINVVRQLRKVTPIRESHFFDFQFDESQFQTKPTGSLPQLDMAKLKQSRLMYQAALIYVLRGQRTQAALSYMGRALANVRHLTADSEGANLFKVAQLTLLAMANAQARVSLSRKRLLADLDREIKKLIDQPEQTQLTPNLSVLKETLFILAGLQSSGPEVDEVMDFFQLTPVIDEQTVQKQQDLLFSPGKSVLRSLSAAIFEDLDLLKEMVNVAARTDGEEFDPVDASNSLQKIADVLLMIGLPSPSNVLKTQAKQVAALSTNPSIDQLLSIADAVLYCETAVSRINKDSSESDDGLDERQIAMRSLVNEAKVVLIDR